MRVTVLGAGSWGTALGYALASKSYAVTMWDIDGPVLADITERHENARYLSGITLPPGMTGEPDLERALAGAELVVLAVPSHAMRVVANAAAPFIGRGALICSVTKGIEVDNLMTMSEVLQDVLPGVLHPRLTFLSGPSFAVEVAREFPTAVTVAGSDDEVTVAVQHAFHTPFLRPYVTDDVVGVEIGGCAKNVIAIATGAGDGLGFDANTRAAMITRGLAEITRLAVARGANPLTLSGLSGVGDLVLTCSSVKSRNYRVGFGLGQGRSLDDVCAELGQVAEGVLNAKSVKALAAKAGVEMPISSLVHGLIYEDLSLAEIFAFFSSRPLRAEREDPAGGR
ncbi:MAG TPA: NAD(P)H-dependent glycerol-3-phosphate dehydrogenase [Tetrasphaera sp.]|uniref:Glycerol-3-phosphate dehydrogenase [NAD(P)+] n=1 Tax=Nostocoides vanveenii TaxID=330835 RepID=A0ABN2KAP2_9MICO|nr:NAD(P)H-dependent glycerol-3-phosphate dehydrogenase [Tetrasphaera sp.]HNQ08402.1 NAD(P)H-dependent glycerol-3-phosphate dehydrogenase [Tetrasphaera sp.]